MVNRVFLRCWKRDRVAAVACSVGVHSDRVRGESVAELDETVYWISKARQRGPAVHKMVGLEQQLVSTPDIDRILATSDLSSVAYGIKISGHSFYKMLGLRDIDVTLAFDATSGTWAQWTSLTAQAPKSCTLSQSGGVAAACTAHGYADGAAVLTIAGGMNPSTTDCTADPRHLGEWFCLQRRQLGNKPGDRDDYGDRVRRGYFLYSHYVAAAGRDLVLHETTGDLVEISPAYYTDDGVPIALKLRTKARWRSEDFKSIGQIRVIGDKQGGEAMLH